MIIELLCGASPRTLLSEDYWDTVVSKHDGKTYEIYFNPKLDEVKMAAKASDDRKVRWIGFGNEKEVYVFSSNLLHDEARTKVGYSQGNPYIRLGTSRFDGRYILLNDRRSERWEWLEQFSFKFRD
jgi:hypothetical protein